MLQRLFLFFTAFFIAAPLLSQPVDNPDMHSLLVKGITLSGQQRYAEALDVFNETIEKFPKHPAGYLNKAILRQVITLDFETPLPHSEFTKLLSRTRSLAYDMLKNGGDTAEAYYYIGMSHSYFAYFKFRDGNDWLEGLDHGMKANDWFVKALQRNPQYYDAMTGAGTYKFWKSKKMEFIAWTGIVEDERKEGIRLLEKAAENGAYTASQAANALIWIYMSEERYDAALRTAKRMLEKYPKHRLFLWGAVSAAEKLEQWSTVLDACKRILASMNGETKHPLFVEVHARAKIAEMSAKLRDIPAARSNCDWVLANANGSSNLNVFTEEGKRRIKEKVEEMEELKEELN